MLGKEVITRRARLAQLFIGLLMLAVELFRRVRRWVRRTFLEGAHK